MAVLAKKWLVAGASALGVGALVTVGVIASGAFAAKDTAHVAAVSSPANPSFSTPSVPTTEAVVPPQAPAPAPVSKAPVTVGPKVSTRVSSQSAGTSAGDISNRVYQSPINGRPTGQVQMPGEVPQPGSKNASTGPSDEPINTNTTPIPPITSAPTQP